MEAIGSVFEQVRFAAGELIIAAGDPMEHVYLIAQVCGCGCSCSTLFAAAVHIHPPWPVGQGSSYETAAIHVRTSVD